jgi:MFS family permease
MLWLVSFFNYADRMTLITVIPSIRSEFHLSAAHVGLLSSVFLWVYALAAVPAGLIGDRFNRSNVILLGLTAWSLTTLLTPLANSLVTLLWLRALTGLGEATYYPTGTALISDYHTTQTRGRALSLHQTAVFAGGGIGAVVAAWLADDWGWRTPFMVYGIAGVLLAIVLAPYLRGLNRADRPKSIDRPAGELFKIVGNRRVMLLCVTFLLATAGTAAVTTWAPIFFHDVHGLSLQRSSLFGAAAVNLAGLVAVPLGGAWGDAWVQRRANGRILVLLIGLLGAGFWLAPIAAISKPLGLSALLFVSSICKGLFDGTIYAALHDLVSSENRALAVGLMTTVGFCGAGLAPLIIGLLSERMGLGLALACAAIPYALGGALLIPLSRCLVEQARGA